MDLAVSGLQNRSASLPSWLAANLKVEAPATQMRSLQQPAWLAIVRVSDLVEYRLDRQ